MSKTKPSLRQAAGTVIMALALMTAAAAQSKDDVRRALHEGAHERAAALAREALKSAPDDAELRFLLARATAYAGRWDEAETMVDGLLADYPADVDLIVFKARLRTWREDITGAEALFRRAHELEPRSADALVGLADIASWRGEYDAALVYCRKAIDLDPNHAGALFRTGSVLLWQGRYGQARGYLTRAVELEPRDPDYARALRRAAPLFARGNEVWLVGRNEHFSDGRSDYSDLGVYGWLGLAGDRVKLAGKLNRSWRGGGRDDQVGLEAYPHLWKGAYGYADLLFSPGSDFAPRSSIHLEVYQSFLTRFEASLGLRRMAFPDRGVTVAVGSAAGYLGPWYANVRLFYGRSPEGADFTVLAGGRRYLSGGSYIWAGVGRGARTFEAGSVEDVQAGPSWFTEAGADIYLRQHLRIRGHLALRKESGGPSSLALGLTIGYRW